MAKKPNEDDAGNEPAAQGTEAQEPSLSIERQEDGSVVLTSDDGPAILVTEAEWTRVVAAASAGGASEDRVATALDYHRSTGRVTLTMHEVESQLG